MPETMQSDTFSVEVCWVCWAVLADSMAGISDFARQFHNKVTGLYNTGFLVNRQGKCSDFVVESKDSALFLVSRCRSVPGAWQCEIRAGFAGREFLSSGTDTDLERTQSRFVFGPAKAVLH